jgi:hypothetical protein
MKKSSREEVILWCYFLGALMIIGGFIMILYVFPSRPAYDVSWAEAGPPFLALGLMMIILGWGLSQTWKPARQHGQGNSDEALHQQYQTQTY